MVFQFTHDFQDAEIRSRHYHIAGHDRLDALLADTVRGGAGDVPGGHHAGQFLVSIQNADDVAAAFDDEFGGFLQPGAETDGRHGLHDAFGGAATLLCQPAAAG